MRSVFLRMLSLLLAAALAVIPSAQSPGDVSGHWAGEIQAPSGPLIIHFYLTRDGGTFALPAQGMSQAPVSVSATGRDVRIKIRGGLPRSRTFTGTLAEDGKSITGTFDQSGNGATMPFTVRRTETLRIEAPPKSPAVPASIEGVWSAASATSQQRFTLVIRNQPDGTSAAIVLSAGTEMPAYAIAVTGSTVTVDGRAVGGTFEGTLDATGSVLNGAFKQPSASTPLTLRRMPAGLEALQGFWLATEIDGQSPGDAEAVIAVFGDTYVVIINGTVDERGTLSVNASASPNTIDFRITSGAAASQTQLGIVRAAGETIELAFGAPGDGKRPSSFTAEEARVRFKGRKL